MILKGIDVAIIKMIREDKSISDDAMAERLGVNRQIVREERIRLKIACSKTRRRNTAYLYLDDNPYATSKELADYLFEKGYITNAKNAWDYRNKYKAVAEERQAVRAQFFPERMAA